MKTTILKRSAALFAALVLSLALTACTPAQEAAPEEETTPENTAKVGGSITLPEGFVAQTENNKMTTQLTENTFVGNINMTTYRTSSYFYIVGDSIDVSGAFTLSDANGEAVKTKYTDMTIALWERGENEATYVSSAHFVADGTTQTYTFTGLKNGGEYRLGITFTDRGGYYASGNFSVSQVSATGEDDATAAEE